MQTIDNKVFIEESIKKNTYRKKIEAILGTVRYDYLKLLISNDVEYKLAIKKTIQDEYEHNNFMNKKKDINEIKNVILEKINQLIPIFDIKKDITSYYFFLPNGNKFATERLSEGYKSSIVLLTDILIRIIAARNTIKKGKKQEKENNNIKNIFDNACGVLAIDEFDRHLHPTWQQNYINKLRTVFPKMQLVVTTHNPLSILDREEDEVYELTLDPNLGKIMCNTYKGGTKNMDIVLILLKYFNIDSVVSSSFSEKIDTYYRLLANNEKTDQFYKLEKGLPT